MHILVEIESLLHDHVGLSSFVPFRARVLVEILTTLDEGESITPLNRCNR